MPPRFGWPALLLCAAGPLGADGAQAETMKALKTASASARRPFTSLPLQAIWYDLILAFDEGVNRPGQTETRHQWRVCQAATGVRRRAVTSPTFTMHSLGPLHARTADALRMRIAQGIWRPGNRLPSQEGLCEEFGVSSITMRRSVGSLVAEGLLVRLQGKGTFVSADHDIVQGPPQLTSFTQDVESRGWRSTGRTLQADVRRAAPDITTKLGLPPNALVAVIQRVRFADDEPLAVQVAHLPALFFPGLELHTFDNESLYKVLERVYGVRPATASEQYNAARLSIAEARLLGVTAGSPAFRVERVTSDSSARRIELVRSVIRGDKYTLAVQLSAKREPS